MENIKENKYDFHYLAKDLIVSTNMQETNRNNNILIIGGTGTGKTKSYTESQLLHTENRNLVVSVSKKSLIKPYSKLFKKKGYNVLILDTTDPDNSNIGFDPLKYINSEEDILQLAKNIIDTSVYKEETRDKYWDNSATQLIASEIGLATELIPILKEDSDFKDLDETFMSVLKINEEIKFTEKPGSGFTISSYDNKFEALYEYNPNSYAYRCFQSTKGLASKTLSCILSTVNTAINNMFTPNAIKLIKKPSIDFNKFIKEKTILFIITSSHNESSHMFANLILSQMFKSLNDLSLKEDNYTLPIPIHVICEDFALSAKIQNFSNYISMFRESGISISILIQSESQLELLYGKAASSTIINNCDTILYFGGMDLQTCTDISRRLDTPIREILYMPIGIEYVLLRGEFPIKATRYETTLENDYIKYIKKYMKK